jgi:uncharacterized protein YjiS (DUF1127 family)
MPFLSQYLSPLLSMQRKRHLSTRFPRGLMSEMQRRAGLRRSRRALARLDDHLLADIGLTRLEAATEAARPHWDAPLHWRD